MIDQPEIKPVTELGQYIRVKRYNLGKTLGDMAEAIGVPCHFLSSVEHGEGRFTVGQAKRACSFLGLSHNDSYRFEQLCLSAGKPNWYHKPAVIEDISFSRGLVLGVREDRFTVIWDENRNLICDYDKSELLPSERDQLQMDTVIYEHKFFRTCHAGNKRRESSISLTDPRITRPDYE